MKHQTKKFRPEVLLQITAVTVLLAFIIFSFVLFVRENRRRIIEQNNDFIAEVTQLTARRMDDILDMSQRSTELIARLYSEVMDTPSISADVLTEMADKSMFDYVEFINADGVDLHADGRTADLSDREYFINGMAGESGRCVIHNSRITNETLLIFYTPFYYDGDIIGVLSCILRGDTVYGLLESDYFGRQGSTYLLERNGDIILTVGGAKNAVNLPQYLRDTEKVSESDLNKLKEALDISNDVDYNSFNYKGASGEGSAFATVIDNGRWVLVQSVPSAMTADMTKSANESGVRLEIMLIGAFAAYLVYLVAKNQLQKKRLVNENQEMSNIVEATTRLFTRFSLVDFKNDTYEYLEPKHIGAPQKGAYTDLRKYLSEKYVAEDNAQDMNEIISPEYARKNLTKNVPYLQFEYEIDVSGRRWENMSIICLKRDRKGVPVTVLYAMQDVTALKERESRIRMALKNSSEAAEAANRAKSDFLARMSHDIRTPMNAIMGMTAVAAMHIDDKEKVSDCLGKITVSSKHLLALINDVLDMSKIESGKVSLSEEPFSMADMVESVVTIIKNQVKSKNQELKVHINDIEHENVIGDTLRLRQVFVNILGNAVKFTPEGGSIIFSIRECPSRIHGMACFEFICEDNGIGMDEEFLKTVFDPFSRSKQSANIEGTGLGMPITRNIVRMMSGDIEVESKLGVGSKFTVKIFLKLQEIGDEDVGELADLKVLVADDDGDSCTATCDILGAIGMKAEFVLSGAEAVEKIVKAKENQDGYSAVILDWKMPGMDGVDTAREIRRRVGDDLPIIILSAYDWTDIEAEARSAGVQTFIEKPLFRSRLIYALKSVLSKSEENSNPVTGGLESVSFEGRRVLLVEDNELNMEIAKELLSYTGIEVESAENGEEAVNAIKQGGDGRYDLVFMDIQMPVMNGYDATRAIREIGSEYASKLPIIAMTANAFSDDIWKAQEAGMNDHISKPVEVPKLIEALKKWIGR